MTWRAIRGRTSDASPDVSALYPTIDKYAQKETPRECAAFPCEC